MTSIDDNFPKALNEEELINMGGKQIEGMNYFKIDGKTKAGIYEPVLKKGNKIDFYSLRRVVNKESSN